MAELLALADDETRRAVGRAHARLHRGARASAAARRDRVAVRHARARRRAHVLGRGGGDLHGRERAPRAGRPRDRHLARVSEPPRGRAGGWRGRDAPRAPRERGLGDRRGAAARLGQAAHAAHRRQRPAQPDRHAPGRGDVGRGLGHRRGRRCRPVLGRGLSLPRARPRRAAHRRRRPRPARGQPRRHVEVVLDGRACGSAGSRPGTARSSTGAPGSRTTSRSARRRRPRSSRSSRSGRATRSSAARGRSSTATSPSSTALFERQAAHLRWVRPAGGPIGFPELTADVQIETFAQNLVEAEGVLLAPGPLFGHPGNHFRLGLGRNGMAAGLDRLEAYVERTLH